ncbi:MAG: hypothetical protein ACRD3Q_12445, partial [Terriglobales bacterium]
MGATSTIHAYEMALLTNLKNATLHPTLSGVQILAGPPTAGQAITGEWMMFGNAQGTQSYATFPYNAPTSRDETYTFDLFINCAQALHADHAAVTDRSFTLLAEVENELRSNPMQGVANVLWSEVATSV